MALLRVGVLVTLCLAIVSTAPEVAATPVQVFGNINDPADVDNGFSAYAVGFVNGAQPNIFLAQGFTSGTSQLVVQSIVLGLAADTAISSGVVRIFSSVLAGGTGIAIPGSSLATFTLSGTTAVLDLEEYTFAGSYKLDASTPYWVVVSDAAVPDSSYNWFETENEDQPAGFFGYSYLGTRRSTQGGSNWLNFTAGTGLSLSIAAVPEPSTYALATAGLGLAGLLRARRRKAVV